MSGLTFQKEPFFQAFADAQHLLPMHFDEIAGNKELLGAPDPDLPRYRIINDMGKLHVLTARDGDKLVGYYVAVIDHNLHYRQILMGAEDLYYLAPEYRQTFAGLRFLKEAEKMMREAGAMMLVARTKVAHNRGPVFERLGWHVFEHVYAKVMG